MIRVEHDFIGLTTLSPSMIQGLYHKICIRVAGDRPTNNPSCEEIKHDGQI
jgi:hypothetical protein